MINFAPEDPRMLPRPALSRPDTPAANPFTAPTPPSRWRDYVTVAAVACVMGGAVAIGAQAVLTPAKAAPTAAAAVQGWTGVAAQVTPSVVSIISGNDEGSGVIWDNAGHIVTNNHVIAGVGVGGTVQVMISDQRTYNAEVIGADPTTDLAVLQLENAPAGLQPLAHTTATLHVGDAVMAIGNPLGLSGTVTTGIVSALDRPVATTASSRTAPVVTDAIQTSAAINPGNSGGALVDDQGVLVGINSSIASLGTTSGQAGNIGIGFAIPLNEVNLIVPQLIQSGTAHHAFLGISTTDASVTTGGSQLSGAGVGTVLATGPSNQLLQPRDLITAINGAPTPNSDALLGQIRALPIGQAITLTVYRNGTPHSVTVTLGQSPQS
jgi:putative serine protease PepD